MSSCEIIAVWFNSTRCHKFKFFFMKILTACEYSGTVRDAFADKGWEAWSCDELPSDKKGNHYQGNVLDILNENWDLLIGFPPCTYLTYAGMSNWYDEGRAMKRIKAAEFFMKLYDAKIKYVCIENPQGIMTKIFREPNQCIHPYFFGDKDMKRTNLWLKNLPLLNYVLKDNLFFERTASDKPEPYQIQFRKKTGQKKNRYFTDSITEGKLKTGHEKSKFFKGIANAMAEQWTSFILNNI